ncbi:MAG: purine-binding chemotaxis protein CheW [Spirochaetes bacterium]|nr:MAG: purine-binding chemotaxis protein CheW [Spirochaetota bacterium]
MEERHDAERINKYLTFSIGKELYGMNIGTIKEIIEYTSVTAVPRTPLHIGGVLNLRGNVVPIIDLSARFYGYASAVTKYSCIVVVELDVAGERVPMGVLIDALREVVDVQGEDIETTPGFGAKIRNDFIAGIGKVRDEFVIMLNLERVLDIEELAAFDARPAAGA